MTSLMTRSVILFLGLVNFVQGRGKGLPIRFYDFMAIVNGRYDNSYPDKDKGQDTIWIEVKPALAPGLQKDPVMYVEEALNGKLYRMAVEVRDESFPEDIRYVTYYNFTDPSQHEPGTFTAEDLANVKREDFHSNEGCGAAIEKMSETSFLAQMIDCRHKVKGQHPLYTVAFTCDDIRMVMPVSAVETTTRTPYDMKHSGARYPLIGAPEGYVNPCSDDL